MKRHLLLIALFLSALASFSVPQTRVLDTALAPVTSIFLSPTGRAEVVVNPLHYNVLTDSVYLSQSNFGCADINLWGKLYLQIFDVSGTLPIQFYSDSTTTYVQDTSAPVVLMQPATTLYLNASGADTLKFDHINLGSWDSCGINLTGFKVLTKTIYDCQDIGTSSYQISVPDYNGNNTVVPIAITVLDTTKPALTLKSDTLVLTNGNALLDFARIDAGSADNCGITAKTLNGLAQLSFTCADTGVHKIVVEIADASGNVDRDSVQVYVADTVAATYTKTPHTAYLVADSVIVKRSNILANVLGSCFPAGLVLTSDTVFYCADISTNPNFITFQISSGGKTITDSVSVTVIDINPPLLSLKTDTVFLTGLGSSALVNFSAINNGSSDNCGLDTASLNGAKSASFSCADTGWQKIVVVLFDVRGNATTDSVQVYVADTLSPSYTKNPFTAYLVGGTVNVQQADVLSQVTGGCFVPTVTFLTPTSFACNAVFTNPNYLKFTVQNGVKSILDSVAVTVLDTVKPTLLLKADTLILVNGNASLTFANVDDNSVDNCGLDSAQINGMVAINYTCADTGMQKVEVKLYDVSGNFSTDSVSVFVADTISPTYTKMPYTASLIGSSVSVSRANLLSNISAGCFPPAVSFLSDTVFTCADVISSPNFVKFSFVSGTVNHVDSVAVTVIDTVKPTLALQGDTFILVNNAAAITFAEIDNGSFDNCSLDSASLNGLSELTFTCADSGMHKIGVVLYDINGNSKADSVTIYVRDTISPTYTKTPFIAYLDGNSVIVHEGDILTNVAAGCFTPSVNVLSDSVFDCADIVANPNFIKFSVSTGTQVIVDSVAITVVDSIRPVVQLKSDTIFLSNGLATIKFSRVDDGSTDNCGIDFVKLNGADSLVINCTSAGKNKIGVSVTDVHGNTSTDSVVVYVQDSLVPTYNKNSVTAYLVGNQSVISRSDFLTSIVSGCSAPFVEVYSDTVFSCANTQSNPNYIKFSVSNGLSPKTDSIAVTVLDTTLPSLSILPPPVISLGANGERVLTPTDLLVNFPTDNCGIDSVSIVPSKLTCANAQNYSTIIITVYDLSGNYRTISTLALAQDNTPPIIVSKTDTIYLDALNGTATLSIGQATDTIFDGCGINSASLSKQNFNCSDVGLSVVYVTAVDGSNNQTISPVNVYVLDTLAPIFTAFSQRTLFLDPTGNATINAASLFIVPPVDGCGIQDTVLSQVHFSCANIGSNQETLTVTDIHGNSTDFAMDVNVIDTIRPVFTVQNVVIPIDSSTGLANVTVWDVLVNWSDNCGIDSANSVVIPSVFDCNDIGPKTVNVVIRDKSGNTRTRQVLITISGAVLTNSIIEGPMEICANAYNVKYAVKDFRNNSTFEWQVTGGTIISKSYRGREIYVHWNKDTNALSNIVVTELNPLNCGEIQSDTVVTKYGSTPDVARVVFWSDATKNTLVCTETEPVIFQWGYDEFIGGQWMSTSLAGQNANSYYNVDIEKNMDVFGYRYWCETSYNGECWNRAYMENSFPINIGENMEQSSEIWPNPFTNQLRIKSNLRVANIEIFDALGQHVWQQKVGEETSVLIGSLGHLAPATYMLKITYKNGNVSNHKIVHTN